MKHLLLISKILGLATAVLTVMYGIIRLTNPAQPVTLTNPPAAPSQSTMVVIAGAIPPVVTQPAPAPAPTPAPLPVHNVGFNGVFEGSSGLHYQFEQNGAEVKLYLLNTNGDRRYVGTAYDEGTTLRFESFYSPVYEKWGTFPAVRVRGEELVSIDGAETVFFRRVS
ncbi:MAG TPA: hypothetical protein VJZ00_25550 [Thermoanaerobaculia bacterium]|nr:hypothetical protein [Thermoanaerobaculia bacterium]